MSKTKTAVTFASVFTKVIIGIAAVALIACIIILTTKCAKTSKKDYYECTKYEWHYVNGTNPGVINQLEQYEYYRLYLNSDKTFTIKYVLAGDTTERSEVGTYVKEGTTYTLKYSGLPTQDLSSEVTYHLEDGLLQRSERALSPSGTNYTIVQVFSNK